MKTRKIIKILAWILLFNISFLITASYLTGIIGHVYLIAISKNILNDAVTNKKNIEKELYKVPMVIISKKKVHPTNLNGEASCYQLQDNEYMVEYSSIFGVKIIAFYNSENKIIKVYKSF